jgi:hypothetical protein
MLGRHAHIFGGADRRDIVPFVALIAHRRPTRIQTP